MTKIRKLKLTDIKKIRELIEYVEPATDSGNFSEEDFILFPFDALHNYLPLNMKFLQECYVAVENKNVLGLIALIPDGKQKTRWKINRLVLNVNASEIGKQLVDYVVNKYGGEGVETFITTIDEKYPEAIALLKNGCGFRSCNQINIWEKESLDSVADSGFPKLFREVKSSDARNIQELDSQCLFPHFRPSLAKSENDFKFNFKSSIINFLRNYKVKRLVLENPAKNVLEGYVLLMSEDNRNFWADIILSLPYQEYYEDILNYISGYVGEQNKNAKLHVYARKYYQNSKRLGEILVNLNFKQTQNFQVLVKDYWKTTKTPSGNKSPIIIFPDITSPACNIVRVRK